MKTGKVIYVAFGFMCLTGIVRAADGECEKVISLSKTVKDTVKSQDDFEANATAFCSEYSKSESNRNKSAYGASYKFISASIGKENASESEIASKFCSATSNSSKKQAAYKEYVETISPDAFSAYEKCKALEGAGLTFDIDTNGIKELDLTISVAYRPGPATPAGSKANLKFTSSSKLTCHWDDPNNPSTAIEIPAGSVIPLSCTRLASNKEGYVKVLATNIGSATPLTLNWQAYGEDGVPINLTKTLISKVENAVKKLEEVSTSMTNSVIAFNVAECPAGWEQYVPAFGRFIRGIDKSESKIDPSGLRILGSLQPDQLGRHTHDLSLQGASGNSSFVTRTPAWGYDNWHGGITGTTTTAAGGDETRPKNVALLYCTKK